jgi:succinate dehydrogenase / fumarate reductase iron-sulfur subunit
MNEKMTLYLKIWRQANPNVRGKLVDYTVKDVNPHMSFLEMLDVLNEDLIKKNEVPIEFDSDCREGICGTCGMVIAGVAHGPKQAIATCQLHMRNFKNGDTITVEPFRAKPFPPIKDLVIDKSALDRIISRGGYVSVNTGSAKEANLIAVARDTAETAMDAAVCIGCGACVASCPNASAYLFTGAKISQYALMPQGHPERKRRVMRMVTQMDEEGFGDCSNHAECQAVCPVKISITNIARMRREYIRALFP